MNIAPQSLDQLVRLGYTPEEARFIYIVATHSGYFTHRQFLEFSGTKPGKHSQKFLGKLLVQKHATYHAYPSGGRVYHIFSRRVYKAIDRDDLRTRRKHQLEYVKTRIVTLDFVLSNLGYEYLETEGEKVPFFEEQLKINRSLLPSKAYSAKLSANQTIRYFVDRFPIFLRDSSGGSSVIVFTYVDAGSATLQGFVTHLEAYRVLLRSLPSFEFIYVAPTERFFSASGSEFSRRIFGRASVPSIEQVLRYFRLRKSWEAGQRVTAAEVVLFNSAKRELAGEDVELQYRKWIEGAISDTELCYPVERQEPQVRGAFSTVQYGDSLSVFHRSGQERSENTDEMPSDGFHRDFHMRFPRHESESKRSRRT